MGKLVSTSSSRYKSSSESRQCPKQLQRLPLFMVVQDRGMSWVSDGTPAPHAIYLRVSRGFMMFHGLIWCNHFWSVQQASTDPSNCIEDVQSLNRLDHRLWEMISIQIITVIRTCLKILERTVYVKRFHWDILRLCVLVLSQDMALFLLQGVSCFLVRIFEGATGTTRVSTEKVIWVYNATYKSWDPGSYAFAPFWSFLILKYLSTIFLPFGELPFMKRFIPLLHCSLVLQVFVMKVSSALTQTGKLGSISKSFEPLQLLHKCATSPPRVAKSLEWSLLFRARLLCTDRFH